LRAGSISGAAVLVPGDAGAQGASEQSNSAL
jgi:hypothetical protein